MSKKFATAKVQALQTAVKLKPHSKKADPYAAFQSLNGRHPWQTNVPEGFVGYPTRKLEKGRVAYFNFALAREMGLIAASHPDELTTELNEKILETFSLQIINEYDQQNGYKAPAGTVKEHAYMATRYLQLQHADKKGRTSGDGRGIWNGTFRNRGTTWDVSSRGTGVTCLSPGSVEANRPLKTGAAEFGYGCGLADTTELVGSAIMSEIFHLNGVPTERVLAVVDLGRGCGIGVRAAPNLIRPAHLFLYLKQGRLDVLRQATDYMIQRQIENGEWKFSATAPDRYQKMLSAISLSFARFAAHLERNYIFAWLDWDGDNVLANAGIIDYGSIRQFGLRHDQYKYDDVQRFSTNLNEQRGKARQIVEVFAQLANFLETGKKKGIAEFVNDPKVREFDREFDRELRRIFLRQVGFDVHQIETLMKKRADVERLYSTFLVLEKTKTKAGMKKVPDGLNRPAVFNMRAVLRELPTALLTQVKANGSWSAPKAEALIQTMSSSWAKKVDLRLKGGLRERIEAFTKAYVHVLKSMSPDAEKPQGYLRALAARAEEENRADRITGNGAEFIVEAVVNARKKGLTFSEIQNAVELFIASQSPAKARSGRLSRPTSVTSASGRLFQELTNIAHDWEEDI